jgi:hypothetical protein
MTPEDLDLFARNLSDLYDQHCNWAKNSAPLNTWNAHVRYVLLPRYRQEFNEPCEGMSLDDLELVAQALMRHYAKHVAEVETQHKGMKP